MAYSSYYKALDARIKILRARFLPPTFSKLGTYSSVELDNARAFRLLAHAEIEEYLEQRALDVAKLATTNWVTAGKHSKVALHLAANQIGSSSGLPEKLGSGVSAVSIVQNCFAQYAHSVRHNHGIRTANILTLLLPVGFAEAEIDLVWLATIDGFGAARGKTAHTSAVTHAINPKDDFQTVQAVVVGLKDIDMALNRLKRALR